MRRYYRYHFISSLPVLAVSLIIGLFTVGLGFITDHAGWFSSDHMYTVNLSVITTVFILEAFIYAALEFSSFRNKRNLDTWFSFPLSREKIAIVHALNAYTMFAIQTVVYFVYGSVLILIHDGFNYVYFIPAMLAIFVFTCLLFNFVSCVFLFGNSIADGALCVFAWMNVPSAIVTVIRYITAMVTNDYSAELYSIRMGITEPLDSIVSRLAYLINKRAYRKYRSEGSYYYDYVSGKNGLTDKQIMVIVIWLVLFIVATILLPRIFSKRPTEKIGGVSDFPLAYEFIIPFFTLFIILMGQEALPLRIFAVIGSYIAYAIYRKSPNITLPRFIVVGVMFVIALIPFFDIFGV